MAASPTPTAARPGTVARPASDLAPQRRTGRDPQAALERERARARSEGARGQKERDRKTATRKKSASRSRKKAAAAARPVLRQAVNPVRAASSGTAVGVAAATVGLVVLYVALTNASILEGFLSGIRRGFDWLASPTAVIPFANKEN
jgi:hypothetical protein